MPEFYSFPKKNGTGLEKERTDPLFPEKNATQIRPCALNGIDDNNNEARPMKDENNQKNSISKLLHTFLRFHLLLYFDYDARVEYNNDCW